jgi:hypothetical protein
VVTSVSSVELATSRLVFPRFGRKERVFDLATSEEALATACTGRVKAAALFRNGFSGGSTVAGPPLRLGVVRLND